MFSFLAKEEPPLQLYGKLPIAKDYLRVGCGSDAGRGLRQWLDRGFSGEVGDAAPVLPYALRFLWSDPGGEVLQGTLRPSSDAGGLRVFPFALFVERRRKAIKQERALTGAGDEGWWRALERCQAELSVNAEGGALLAAARGCKVQRSEPGEKQEAASGGVDLEAWIAALWPHEGRAGFDRALQGIEAALRGATRDERIAPLRLPLAWGSPMGPQVDAWTRALQELGWDSRRSAPTLFYPESAAVSGASPAAAFLLVLARPPEPSEVRWLHSVSRTPFGAGDFVAESPAPVLPRELARPTASSALASQLSAVLASRRARAEG